MNFFDEDGHTVGECSIGFCENPAIPHVLVGYYTNPVSRVLFMPTCKDHTNPGSFWSIHRPKHGMHFNLKRIRFRGSSPRRGRRKVFRRAP